MIKTYGLILLTILFSMLHSGFSVAQDRTGKVALKINELKLQKRAFEEANIFESIIVAENEKASSAIRKYTLLTLNASALNAITQTGPELLTVSIPSGNARSSTQLLLYKVNISRNGFTLETSDGRRLSELNPIVHYRGIIAGDPKSVVSLSFSKEETMGLICNDEGNYVLGKFEDDNADAYVFYNDKELIPVFNYECGTNTLNPAQEYKSDHQGNQNPNTMSLKCVDWYYEIDYDIFVGKGSLANVNSYIQGVFNQVSTLYDNDGISITLQTLYVWTASDPYTGPTTSNYLSQFGAYRTSFAGDVANLVGYAGGGGVAYVNGLCASNTANRMGYMGISSSYNTVPTYSWTVEVVTHEDGHLLGSRHTHDCVWNGNNTRIDNCGPQAGYNSGSCAAGPLPSNGTIMSYCHLVSGVGINFNNGFGPQPTALILDNVNTASCLSACTSCPTPPQPGNISGNPTYCGVTAQSYSITAVSGATSYIWTLPAGWSGTSTTNTINATTAATGGSITVTAVNSCGNSIARSLTVTGNSGPGQAGNLQGSSSVCQGSSEVYSISPISGAASYTWTLPAGWSGSSSSNSITVIPGANSGTVSVMGVNACGNSSTRTISVTANSTPAQPLSISGQSIICGNTSYIYDVPLVTGATTYNWVLPSGWSGSSISNIITVVTGVSDGSITVSATNSCGTSGASSLLTTLAVAPAKPSSILTSGGTIKVCPGDVISYSVNPVPNSTSYTWTAPDGGVVSGGQGTTTVIVTYNQGFSAHDTLRVVANNGCAVSQERILRVFRNTPVKPSVINGPAVNGCNLNNIPYSVNNVAGINYNWSFTSNNATVTSGQGSNSITADFGLVSGANTLNVTASNACGVSAVRTLNVSSNPGQPGAITGTVAPCANQQGVPYSISPVSGAISYTWTVPTGARINDGTVTSSSTSLTTTSPNVTVNFKTTSGNVRVKATNSCSTGANRTLSVSFGCRMENIESGELQEVLIYPNPAENVVKLQNLNSDSGIFRLQFSDLSGKIILEVEGEINIDENEIDISSLPSGVYFVSVYQNENRHIQKLVKL